MHLDVQENPRLYRDPLKIDPDSFGILDFVVSFDAAWEKRVRQSHIGIAFIMEAN